MSKKPEAYGELGQVSLSDTRYNPKRLFSIAREPNRLALGLNASSLPFVGIDVWNHYEVSWLNALGKPCVAMARIIYDCSSPNLIESKSLKLYFNSLNQSCFESAQMLTQQIKKDLSACLETDVLVQLFLSSDWKARMISERFSGYCVDDLNIACSVYDIDSNLLELDAGGEVVEEQLCSELLRSNCPVTNQPDWGSVQVSYKGPRISPESFLKYIVSFRNHQGFHEQCIEQIFIDLSKHCTPEKLTVYGRYTRRGGLDINPYRSTEAFDWHDDRFEVDLMRQ
ncbi:MAG: NADPH-dependent 7-cyano-7-deazaguanine reductase QueF [Gammaproteobacteria bacterium]|nr:NADPH-dependent 7-cyano-7-deazaguanine reductase QueF [Gammaproteobacteria bacterium]